jgi:hypothetical protein
MKEPDQAQIADALGILPSLVNFALQEKWERAHKLARVGMPQNAFGDPLEDPLKSWWQSQLSQVAQQLAGTPIVQTADGAFHRVNAPSPNADFILPRFDLTHAADELDFTSVWQAASELEDPLPPALEIAPEWTAIATEWMDLGVSPQRLALILPPRCSPH